MKKDQNRNVMPYPVYPPYQGMAPMMPNTPMLPGVPMMGGAMPYTMGNTNTGSCSSSNATNTDSIKESIENLNKRVSYLENMLLNNNTNYNNNYNSSNYQMM